jgi:hypothetical protein
MALYGAGDPAPSAGAHVRRVPRNRLPFVGRYCGADEHARLATVAYAWARRGATRGGSDQFEWADRLMQLPPRMARLRRRVSLLVLRSCAVHPTGHTVTV